MVRNSQNSTQLTLQRSTRHQEGRQNDRETRKTDSIKERQSQHRGGNRYASSHIIISLCSKLFRTTKNFLPHSDRAKIGTEQKKIDEEVLGRVSTLAPPLALAHHSGRSQSQKAKQSLLLQSTSLTAKRIHT